MQNFSLSPSTLNLFLECPRCFWLEKVEGIRRPRGIFPSLPGGMDRVIKTYFDEFRNQTVNPPELAGEELEGVRLYPDQGRIARWRNWRTGLEYRDDNGSVLIGALDDLLIKDGRHIPFDYKTKGSPATQESAVRYYQNQLDLYALMLEANALPTTGYGYLIFYSPLEIQSADHITFEHQVIQVPTDHERARKVFREAIDLLKGPEPQSGRTCEYCGWVKRRAGR